jgi:hypothetical protein
MILPISRFQFGILLAAGCLISIPYCEAENYLSELAASLRPESTDTWPPGLSEKYDEAHKAHSEGDNQSAYEIYLEINTKWRGKLEPDLQTYFRAEEALSAERINRHELTLEILDEIKEDRLEPDEEEIRFLVELEAVRIMSQCGDSPVIPHFDPTMEQKEERYRALFRTYDPFQTAVLDAHADFALDAYDEAMSAPGREHYMDIAIGELKEIEAIVSQVKANPDVAKDSQLLTRLDMYSDFTGRSSAVEETQRSLSGLPPDLSAGRTKVLETHRPGGTRTSGGNKEVKDACSQYQRRAPRFGHGCCELRSLIGGCYPQYRINKSRHRN